ncbi:sulfatase [Rubritalea tangerina]|uniref:Sulfatase n=1 Tax=Rubritalea tangerina TaxID=430798 RepID=A0ABW4Z9C1_9BACT
MKTLILALTYTVTAHASEIRNILFIVSDDLKASVLGCYGDTVVRTPNIDKLASRGMVFEHAYCQAVWCAPSRASFMAGQYTPRQDAIGMGEFFREQDIFSARVGKIYHMRVPGDTVAGTDGADHPDDWDVKINAQGLEAHTPGLYALLNTDIETTEMQGRQSTGTKHRMFVTVKSDDTSGADQPDYKAASSAIALLNKHKDKPFFLALGFVRPHYPSVAPKQYFDHYPLEQIKLPKLLPADLNDVPKEGRTGNHGLKNGISHHIENQKKMWQGYYATVEFMDVQLGRVLDELDRLGLRESTAIVFTSDHGYHLGEKELWEKYNLHEEVSRVPLIISAPGYPPGRSTSCVELIDIYPTVTTLAGLPAPSHTDGYSLTPILKDPTHALRAAAYSYYAKGHALRSENSSLLSFPSGDCLYDMRKDPHQFYNLATNPEYRPQLESMQRKLQEKLTTLSPPPIEKRKK